MFYQKQSVLTARKADNHFTVAVVGPEDGNGERRPAYEVTFWLCTYSNEWNKKNNLFLSAIGVGPRKLEPLRLARRYFTC